MATIDAAKYHHGNGAETEEDAAWHIGLFLLYCAERGLAAPHHSLESLRADATQHVLSKCGGKLWDTDLSPEGAALAARFYDSYLAEVADLAMADDRSAYEMRSHADQAGIRQVLFEFLDVRASITKGSGGSP